MTWVRTSCTAATGLRAPAQRLGEHRKLLFRHLAGVRVLCREEVTANDPMHSMGEELDADVDMLAAREMPQVGMWLKHVVRARCGDG